MGRRRPRPISSDSSRTPISALFTPSESLLCPRTFSWPGVSVVSELKFLKAEERVLELKKEKTTKTHTHKNAFNLHFLMQKTAGNTLLHANPFLCFPFLSSKFSL